MERIAPSARLEAQIEELLGDELAANGEKLAELGRLGARLVLQRAVEDEVTAFLGRARYQRTAEAAGSRNGTRPKRVQTAEGEINVDIPQVRGTAAQFISRVFPDSRTVIRTRPLVALIIGGCVRGLSRSRHAPDNPIPSTLFLGGRHVANGTFGWPKARWRSAGI